MIDNGRFRNLLSTGILAAVAAIAVWVPHGATAADGLATANAAPTPFVQRWGLDSASGAMDYHAGTNRLLTAHGEWAVLWEVATGRAVEAFPIGGGAVAVAFDAAGRHVLTASGDGPLRVWDLATGQRIAEFAAPPSTVQAAAISPDGRRVAAGCYDHTVLVGQVGAGSELQQLDGHRGHVIFVRFAPDSRRLLSGSYDNQAILWDLRTGRLERIFPVPVETRWADFRADGRRLVTLGSGTEQGMGRVIQWDIATRQPVQVIAASVRLAWFVGEDLAVLMPDNELRRYRDSELSAGRATEPAVLAAAGPAGADEQRIAPAGGWRVWQPRQCAEAAAGEAAAEHPAAAELRSPSGETLPLPLPLTGAESVEFVTVSPDGRWLLTSFRRRSPRGDRARLVLWDLAAPAVTRSFPGTLGCFHPDGQRVLVGQARKFQLLRIADGQPLQTYEIDAGEFESARFVAAGRQLLTASGDWYDGNQGQVLLWDVETGKVLRDYLADDTAARQAVMDREERRMLAAFTWGESGGIDRLNLYDANSLQPLQVITKDEQPLGALRAAPQVNRFAAGNERQTSVWDLTDSRLVQEFPGLPAAFSADGTVLATWLRRARTTLLWDLENGHYLGSWDAEIVGFHPGGALAFTQDQRAALGLLELRTGRQIAELFTFGEDQWLAVSAAGELAGTDEALRRVTWRVRREQGSEIIADPAHTAQQSRPQQVVEVLASSLADGDRLTDMLAEREPVLADGIERRSAASEPPQLCVRSAQAPACTWLEADAQGKLLLAAYEDGSAALWQLRPVRLLRRFPSLARPPRIALTPDGGVAIVQGPERGELMLWDADSGRKLGLLHAPHPEHREWIAALAMHPQGKHLAVLYHRGDDASPGRTLIWDLTTRQVARRVTDPSPRRMTDIAFTPDGRQLVVAYRAALKDQAEPWDRLEIWDWQAETRARAIRGDGFGAAGLAFSDDGQRLLVKEGSNLVLRDFPTGEVLARWAFRDGIITGALCDDGAAIVASTLGDGRLFRSSVAAPEQWTWTPPVEGRSPHNRYAYAHKLLVREDRNLVFSPGNDGRIHAWRLDSLLPVADLFSRNGHRDWIARTSTGAFAVSEGAKPQLAWESGGRRWPLERFERWLNHPDTVGALLSGQPIEPPQVPAEVLAQTETYRVVEHEVRSPHAAASAMRRRAAERMKQAGAELRINRHDWVTFVHLERRPVDDELLQLLPWLSGVERLYLAATGITDDQLRPVGLMSRVKRLSLWGNPISDAGLAELSALWSLEVLDIHSTAVTAAGLRQLRWLPQLKTLIVPADVDADQLAETLDQPGLQIIPRAEHLSLEESTTAAHAAAAEAAAAADATAATDPTAPGSSGAGLVARKGKCAYLADIGKHRHRLDPHVTAVRGDHGHAVEVGAFGQSGDHRPHAHVAVGQAAVSLCRERVAEVIADGVRVLVGGQLLP